MTSEDHPDRLPEYAERVLEVAELIPPGRVMTYGDVAEWLGEGGPRQVGRVMALYGGSVPWWRVVRADGRLLPGHEHRALGHYRAEGTPLRDPAPVRDGAPLRAAAPLPEGTPARGTAPERGAAASVPRLDMRRARWDGDTGAGSGDAGDTGHAMAHN
ncbi:MGMT family protein [Streptomyces kanasensis]|uniref:MGMT family protein n=1 Tax=Streptomyces kanasensis TaxID=936756 RepID=UPI0036FEAE19